MFGQTLLGPAVLGHAIAARSQLGPFLSLPLPFLPHRESNRTDAQPRTNDALLGRLGTLEVRLATSAAEIRRAQRLRYCVFVEEGPGSATFTAKLLRRDADRYDHSCEHLLVTDHAALPVLPPLIKGYLRLGAFCGDGAALCALLRMRTH